MSTVTTPKIKDKSLFLIYVIEKPKMKQVSCATFWFLKWQISIEDSCCSILTVLLTHISMRSCIAVTFAKQARHQSFNNLPAPARSWLKVTVWQLAHRSPVCLWLQQKGNHRLGENQHIMEKYCWIDICTD